MRKTSRRTGLSLALGICLSLATALSTTPAFATVSQGFVSGWNEITDDWGDEGPLSASQNSYTYAVGLWQWVLVAENVTKPDGTWFTSNDVDCQFGPNTTYATKQLQRRWTLKADGIVGPNTFGRAGKNLYGDVGYVGYHGAAGHQTLLRSSEGHYFFPTGTSDSDLPIEDWNWLIAYYDQASTVHCRWG